MRKKFKEFKNKPSDILLMNRRIKIHTSILSSFKHSNLFYAINLSQELKV